MEEILILIIQVVLETLWFFPWDIFLYFGEKQTFGNKFAAIILGGFLGAGLGGLSLLFFPHSMLASSSLRIASLFLSPTLSGLTSLLIARHFHKKNQSDVAMHIIAAVVLVFFLSAIRFAYASHI